MKLLCAQAKPTNKQPRGYASPQSNHIQHQNRRRVIARRILFSLATHLLIGTIVYIGTTSCSQIKLLRGMNKFCCKSLDASRQHSTRPKVRRGERSVSPVSRTVSIGAEVVRSPPRWNSECEPVYLRAD